MSIFSTIKQASNFSKVTLACCLFMLFSVIAGCVSILMPTYIPNDHVRVKICQPFVMPELKPIPGIPVLPDSILASKDKTDTILVNKIKELRDYSKTLKQDIMQAHEKHQQTCR